MEKRRAQMPWFFLQAFPRNDRLDGNSCVAKGKEHEKNMYKF
jgi:hypothetical protein